MRELKAILQILIIVPILAASSCAAGGIVAGGTGKDFNWWVAIIASILIVFSYILRIGNKEQKRIRIFIDSLGINEEYVGWYSNNGIIIDKTNKKIFAGDTDNGKIFNFNEISSIGWVDKHTGSSLMYAIDINTKNFDLPTLRVSYLGKIDLRDEAYAKLRAALNID